MNPVPNSESKPRAEQTSQKSTIQTKLTLGAQTNQAKVQGEKEQHLFKEPAKPMRKEQPDIVKKLDQAVEQPTNDPKEHNETMEIEGEKKQAKKRTSSEAGLSEQNWEARFRALEEKTKTHHEEMEAENEMLKNLCMDSEQQKKENESLIRTLLDKASALEKHIRKREEEDEEMSEGEETQPLIHAAFSEDSLHTIFKKLNLLKIHTLKLENKIDHIVTAVEKIADSLHDTPRFGKGVERGTLREWGNFSRKYKW